MKSKKQGYVIYKSWHPVFKSLPDEAAGKLLKAMAAFQDGEDITLDDPMLSAFFTMIKHTFVLDAEKYAEVCEQRREAGRKGGRPRKEGSGPEGAVAEKGRQEGFPGFF